MYTRILVPLDGSTLAEQALPYAATIAKGLRARLELLRAVPPVDPELADPTHGLYLDGLAESFRSQAEDYLTNTAKSFIQTGLKVVCTVREGDAASSIVDEAEKVTETIIAMSTHGRSGITRWVLGSVAGKVLHATQKPLLLVRSDEEVGTIQNAEFKNVIVPLDGSPEAEQILPHVIALAKSLHLHVTTVRSTPSEGDYQRYMEYHYEVGPGPVVAKVYDGPYEEFAKGVDAKAMDYLHGVGQRLRRDGVTWVQEQLLHGGAADAIGDVAQQKPATLVAMSTHGRSGLGRWILGSVTDRVIQRSTTPVLVVRAQ
jgi:nucleotide-binding universal stress UspA family protein